MLLCWSFGSVAAPPILQLASAGYFPSHHSAAPPLPDESNDAVELPYLGAKRGEGDVPDYAWFALAFSLAEAPRDAFEVMLYASDVPLLYINGIAIAASPSDPSPRPDPRFVPSRFDVPPSLLHAGDNRLLVRIGKQVPRIALSRVVLGERAGMEPRYQREHWLVSTASKIAGLAIIGIGDFFFVLWLRRRKETLYGLFALSCALWVVLLLPSYAMPDAADAMRLLRGTAAVGVWLVAVTLKLGAPAFGYDGSRGGLMLVAISVGSTLLVMLVPKAAAVAVCDAVLGLCWGVAAVLVAALVPRLLRGRESLAAALWLALIVTGSCVAADFALALGWRAWPGMRLAPFGALFYAAAVGWAMIDRFIRQHNQHAQLKLDLEAEAGEREATLAARYEAAARLDRQFAAAAERERFLTEVHDGLGADLRQAGELAVAGRLTATAAADRLSAAMNELRIAIESSKPGARELLTMLGSLRYRLESRLRRAGITLEWDIEDDVPVEDMDPVVTADISRIAYEAFSNAIRHSGATRLALSVRKNPAAAIEVRIADDGHGFDVEAQAGGRGLRNMHRLAARLGAQLHITSQPGDTCLSLCL